MVLFAVLAVLMFAGKGKLFDFTTDNIKGSLFMYLECQFIFGSTIFLAYRALSAGSHFHFVIYFLSLANFMLILYKYKQETRGNIFPAIFGIVLIFILMIPLSFAASHV
jgi:hypothetical protein